MPDDSDLDLGLHDGGESRWDTSSEDWQDAVAGVREQYGIDQPAGEQ